MRALAFDAACAGGPVGGGAPGGRRLSVRGEHVTLENVVVRADQSTTLDVDLSDIPARATIGAGSSVRLDVSGAIAFRGTRKNVWFTVAREIAVANGVVHLAEGAELVHARADGDGVVASVVQWADDVLPGEDKDPDEVIVGVRVPCRAVRLGNKHGENDDDDDEATAETTTDDAAEANPASEPHGRFEPDLAPALGWWRNRGPRRSVAVRAAPRADAAVVTLATSVIGEGQFDFEGVEARGAWLRMRRAHLGRGNRRMESAARSWSRSMARWDAPPCASAIMAMASRVAVGAASRPSSAIRAPPASGSAHQSTSATGKSGRRCAGASASKC